MTSGLDLAEVSKANAPQVTDVPAAPGIMNEKSLIIPEEFSPSVSHRKGSYADDDGKEYPTEEEVESLRRVCGTVPWSSYTIAFVELCERFSYYGTIVVCKLVCIETAYCWNKISALTRSDSRQFHSAPPTPRIDHW